MSASRHLSAIVEPVINAIPQQNLRQAVRDAFAKEPEAVKAIEKCFEVFPSGHWSRDLLCTVAASWKATHLKMLAIYGLSCRLQRMAAGAESAHRDALHAASAQNAGTSHEDLGLDFDAHTHAELYEDLAEALVGDDSWQLGKYRLPEANDFSRWVYRNMVVGDIAEGLLTNMFSEIYNHGEYAIALPAFDAYFTAHSELPAVDRQKALTYIKAHVEDDVEADHFLLVVDALQRYLVATGHQFDEAQAERVFRTYLQRLAPVMTSLTDRMRGELSGRKSETLRVAAGPA
jgi:hypothetical protein